VLQVSGALSHSVLALAGELSFVGAWDCAGAEVVALAPFDVGAELLPPAGAPEADVVAPPVVAGDPPVLLLPLHAETDSAAVSANTAPV